MHSRLAVAGLPRIAARRWLQAMFCIVLCAALAACGFRMKGTSPLPFDTLYTNISENSAFGANIRRAILASSPRTRFVSDPKEADARLMQLSNRQTRRELSIDAEGQVEEYELNLVFVFQLTDGEGRLVLPPTTLQASREIPYDSDDSQAKQSEITMIFRDMQESLVARLVRHLSAPGVTEAFQKAKARPPTDESLEINELPNVAPPQSDIQSNEWDNSAPESLAPFN